MNMRCCFNPKYLLAAAVITAGVWLVAPQAALPAAVVLIALSCPISMFLAMRKPQASCGAETAETGSNDSTEQDPQLDEQIRALRTEIEGLRGQREKA